MSRQDLIDPSDRLEIPARRRVLFNARDMMLAALATPALPALVSPAVAADAVSSVRVVHGFADQQGITFWLQGDKAQSVNVEVRAAEGSGPSLQMHRVELDPRADCTATLRIAELDSGTAHRYTVHPAKGPAVLATGTFRTQVHWQYRTDPPTVRIATGSCAYLNDNKYDRPGKPYGGGEGIFDTIAATNPDLMLWLGDNIYLRDPEWTSREGINRRYRFYRTHPSLRKLWSAAPNIAIWDDHDFGPDDSDASFTNRIWTQEMFRRYWPLPYAAPPDGLYGMVTQGDVDIFMLDDRSYRYPNGWADGPEKAMYGAMQMQWLKAALVYSRAPFKIIAGGNQFWNKASRWECWTTRYPDESQAFRRWLGEAKIPGVIFLSGDIHFARMLRIERPGTYPILELTTSPLTAGPITDPGDEERSNPDMVPGTMYNDRNFAMITVSGPRFARSIAIELMDTQGARKWEWRATAQELGHPPPRPPRAAA
ncbi:MAG: alkaline phosphatase D family protein [Usitatibacter sp.]